MPGPQAPPPGRPMGRGGRVEAAGAGRRRAACAAAQKGGGGGEVALLLARRRPGGRGRPARPALSSERISRSMREVQRPGRAGPPRVGGGGARIALCEFST